MIQSHDEQAIIACCTPAGSGALALLRICGTAIFDMVDSFCKLSSNKLLRTSPTHTIAHGWIIDQAGKNIDEVMFFIMRGPKTFTGQDTLEISCHNNPFIIQKIIEQAALAGIRQAQHGEFSQRAFLNKKIDLIQAEAINELIHASTQQALKQSLAQLQGTFSAWITQLEQDLTHCLALSDASFEFLDEENMEFGTEIQTRLERVLEKISSIKKTFDQQQQIRNGVKIALLGSVNTGKSSLFNALLNKDRAIVTDIAGTTRDCIEAGVYRNGNYWTLIDTAGIRQTDDIIEQQGIERSLHEAAQADIIFLVVDYTRLISYQERQVYQDILDTYTKKIVVIENKIDAPELPQPKLIHSTIIRTSSKHKIAIADIQEAIEHKIAELYQAIEAPFLLNQRQFNLLLTLEGQLENLLGMLKHPHYELISYHLKEALEQLAELCGKTISEHGMDAIFRSFCIGK